MLPFPPRRDRNKIPFGMGINPIAPVRHTRRIFASLTVNLTGRIRLVTENGRAFYVAPLTMIVPGVLNGSKGALAYYPADIAKSVPVWNGVMLTVNHPSDPLTGAHLSANDLGVWDRQGIGEVRNARQDGQGKLKAEGWFDIERTRRVDHRVLNALESGEPMELSTGLYTTNVPAPPGSMLNGRPYEYIARSYKPDHLAILPDQVGACSRNDGCGVLVNSNPEGINQYSQAAGSAKYLTELAGKKTPAEVPKSDRDKADVKKAHLEAYSTHKSAEKMAKKLGMEAEAFGHEKAAEFHLAKAVEYGHRVGMSTDTHTKGRSDIGKRSKIQNTDSQSPVFNPTIPKSTKPVSDKSIKVVAPKAGSVEAAQSVEEYRNTLDSMKPVLNPAVSEAQRRYLYSQFGPEWVKAHGFDNKGELPETVNEEGDEDGDSGANGGEEEMANNVDLAAIAHKWAQLTVNQLLGNAADSQSRHLESGQYLPLSGSSQTQTHSQATKGFSGTTVDHLRREPASVVPEADEEDDHDPDAIEEAADDMETDGAGGRRVVKTTENTDRRFVVIENGVYQLVGNAEAPQGAPVPSTAPTKGPTGLDIAPPLTSPSIEGKTPPPNDLPPASNTKGSCEDCGGVTGNSKGKCVQCGGKMTDNSQLTAADEDQLVPQGTEPMSPRASMIDTGPVIHVKRCPDCGGKVVDGECEDCGEQVENSKVENAMPFPSQQQPTHATTTDAFGASAKAGPIKPRGPVMGALQASHDNDPQQAADSHEAAAEGHEDAATDARKEGDFTGADAHDNAAALHRKAASMHAATCNSIKRDTMIPTQNKEFSSASERKAAFAAMSDAGELSESASKKSEAAGAKSESANKGSRASGHTKAAELHSEAQQAHMKAADAAKSKGNNSLATKHGMMAREHGAAASTHIEKAKSATRNQAPLTLEQRDHLTARITANCGCETDRGALHALSDGMLKTLARNAKAEGSNADIIGDDDDIQAGGEEDEPADGLVGKGATTTPGQTGVTIKKGTQVKNTQQAEHDWLAAAPTENMRTMFADALQHQHNERLSHIGRLTANVSNDQTKRQLTAELMQTPLPKLRLLAATVPVPRQAPAYQPAPTVNYLGQAVPTGPASNSGYDPTSEDMVLPMPRMVWNTKDGMDD